MQNTRKSASVLKRIAQGPAPWLAPMCIVLVAMFIVPTVQVIGYSFTDAKLISKTINLTLKSYKVIFTNEATYEILKNTFIFVFFSVWIKTLSVL